MVDEELTLSLMKRFKETKVFDSNTDLINSIDYDDNSSFLLTSSNDESINIYSLNSGKLHNTIYSKKYGCTLAKFTHRSNNIVYASTKGDDAIRYMSLHDNKYLRYFKGHQNKVISLEISPSEDTFITASLDKTIRFWDLGIASSIAKMDVRGTNPLVAYDPSGQVFAIGINNNKIMLYDSKKVGSEPFLEKELFPNSRPEWTRLSISNDGKLILISTRSSVLYLVDGYTLDIVHTLKGHLNTTSLPLEATFTPDAKYVLCGSSDGKIFMWDTATGHKLNELDWHKDSNPPLIIKFSPHSLIFASANKDLVFWTPSLS
ncbi:WD repeat-containing protein 82-like protein, partial [Globomyces pollinis-pini]